MKKGVGAKRTLENSNRAFLVLVFLLLALVAVPVFLGDYPEMWNMITGQATTSTSTAAITIDSIPVVNYTALVNLSGAGSPITISAGTSQQVNFTFMAFDADGTGDLDNSTARLAINITPRAADGDLYFTNESRYNTTCHANGTINVNTIQYLCSVYIWYWDASGAWTINASVKDSFAYTGENSSTQFQLAQTTAMIMAPSALTWATLDLGYTNRTSNNDPIMINNTGNKNIGLGGVSVSGSDLEGNGTPSYSPTYPQSLIKAQNFSIQHFNATATADCNSGAGVNCYECNGTQLQNGSGDTANPQALSYANITAGNNSLVLRNGTSGQEDLFVCLRLVPSQIPRATYDTTGNWTTAWTVTVA